MISGLVIQLSADDVLVADAIQAIKDQPVLELGLRTGRRQPLVLETRGSGESHDITDWLAELPGVEHVDVVFVHLDDKPGGDDELGDADASRQGNLTETTPSIRN